MRARNEVLSALMRVGYGQPDAERLVGRIEADAVAHAEARPVNDTLLQARDAAAYMFEAGAGERRPMWRVIITDSESPTGIAPVCTAERGDALHMILDYPGGPIRDEEGVYDCCPWPQFDTYSTILAAYLVELLNADTEAEEKDTRGHQPHEGESTPQPPRPHALPAASFARARQCERIGGFFRCARIAHAEAAERRAAQ
ncbi:hypothetical protein [Streptomyces europaeiscabiei]|uniref:hypothetical protein n=1 Tax=Streptomyces europaeiscabiei TaxID=146819 RepID=UPI002E19EE9D